MAANIAELGVHFNSHALTDFVEEFGQRTLVGIDADYGSGSERPKPTTTPDMH